MLVCHQRSIKKGTFEKKKKTVYDFNKGISVKVIRFIKTKKKSYPHIHITNSFILFFTRTPFIIHFIFQYDLFKLIIYFGCAALVIFNRDWVERF